MDIKMDESPAKPVENEHIPFTEESPAKLSDVQVEGESGNK
jgi:hypothetical protein